MPKLRSGRWYSARRRTREETQTQTQTQEQEKKGQELLERPELNSDTGGALFDVQRDEFFGGSLGDAELKDVPRLLLKGIIYMQNDAEAQLLTGKQKKAALVHVMQSLCPHDTLDQIIPPAIDLLVELVKRREKLLATYNYQETETEQERGCTNKKRKKPCPFSFF